MDHKVSKDMISSGMIPSGEKTQADLGRIQYGSAPSPSSLMDAYKSIYEHHQKDKDGNTIPHEGEDIQEVMGVVTATKAARVKAAAAKVKSATAKRMGAEKADIASKLGQAKTKMRMGPAPQKPTSSVMGTVTKGLQGAAKAAGRADQAIAARGGLKKMGTDYLKKNKSNIKGALLGKTAAGTATRIGGAYVAGRMMGGEKKDSGGYSSYDINFGYTPEGDTISEDLFDALKSALIEEGCDEKTAIKVMASITPEFINETLNEENLDEFVFTGAALAGLAAKALAAAKASKLAMAAVKGIGAAKKGMAAMKAAKAAKAASTAAKVTSSGGKVVQGASGASKGGNIITKTGRFVKNKPLETAMVGSMAMPQGGAPKPEVAQRATGTGKRTAGTQNMDLDLFDVVKGQLLDEGLTEEEVLDVMTTLTIDEIKEGLMPTTFKGALVRGAVGAAGLTLANKGLKKAKEKVDDALNKARDENPIGGNRRPGADKIYYGK